MITTVNPASVVLAKLALTSTGAADTSITSGTVRVFQVVSGSEVDVLVAIALANIAGTRWAYTWEPTTLAAGQYFVEFVLADGSSNYLSQEDLLVLDVPTAASVSDVEAAVLSDQNLDSVNNQLVLVDSSDHTTEIARFNTFDADGAAAVQDVTQRVRV